MKKILVFTASLMVAAGAFAQGTVAFNNFISGSLRSPVYERETSDPTLSLHGNASASIPSGSTIYTGALLAGTDYTVQLWGLGSASVTGNHEANNLRLIATTTFRTGTGAGLINANGLPGANVTVPVELAPNTATDAGSKATLQLRAWKTFAGGAAANTWALALAGQLSNPAGHSTLFSPPGDVGGAGTPPALTPNLVGLTSFNIHIVPEPSAIALGVIGLGSLMFLRRRK